MRAIPVLGFFILVFILGFLLLTKPSDFGGTEPNQKLPALALVPLEGKGAWGEKTITGKVTILNFFASWCAPCEAEMPQLLALHKKFPTVKFQGAAWNDEASAIRAALKRSGNPFDGLWLDPKGDATITLGIKGIPETLIIDQQGIVRYRISGPITAMTRISVVEPLLTQLLQEGSHAP